LGPNGAGKSTLMKILTTYIAADEGTALVNGHDKLGSKKPLSSVIYRTQSVVILYVREIFS
jgi:ABC-2 type transport system ATP-binding protein